MDSKELISKFLETYSQATQVAYLGLMNIPLLLMYEKKIGKTLAEFDSDNVLDFFKMCYDSAIEKQRSMATGNTVTIASVYSGFYDWYIEEVALIRNPVTKNVKKQFAEYIERKSLTLLTKDEVEEAIKRIPYVVDPDYAGF